MFDMKMFRMAANNGDSVNENEFFDYLMGFEHIILWGAGNLGIAIGAKLSEMKVPITSYWDVKSHEIGLIRGVAVTQPFTGEYDKEKTLIVTCISNGSSGGEWTKGQLEGYGFKHILNGKDVFEGLMCQLALETGLNTQTCLDATMCNICACDRFVNMLRKVVHRKKSASLADELNFNVMTFVINQKCSLKCKHCGQYMNSYHPTERINFPFERIRNDIDRFLDAVDVVGVISIIGGEAFLHPDFNKIVNHVLSKSNFGVISITTNGVCKMTRTQLAGLKNSRVKIFFSNYTGQLSPKQQELFEKNVALVKSNGINFSIGVPIWSLPSRLDRKPYSVETMTDMKLGCGAIKMCMSVKNGKFFPCSASEPIHFLGLGDYSSDYVDISNTPSREELRRKIGSAIEQPYYQSCAHCGGDCGDLLSLSGEQGLDERYLH